MVDLAGSERQKDAMTTGIKLFIINQSFIYQMLNLLYILLGKILFIVN